MYVDKPMKGHNLMQAIARVNRVFKDKPGGLVVDYIGIANDLKAAMKTYADSKGRGRPAREAEEFLDVLLAKRVACRGLFRENGGFDYSAYKANLSALPVSAANHMLGLRNGKKVFSTSSRRSRAPLRSAARLPKPRRCAPACVTVSASKCGAWQGLLKKHKYPSAGQRGGREKIPKFLLI